MINRAGQEWPEGMRRTLYDGKLVTQVYADTAHRDPFQRQGVPCWEHNVVYDSLRHLQATLMSLSERKL